MSDTVLALAITVTLLSGLAAWVPLLHMAERLALRNKRSARMGERELPQSREREVEPEMSFGPEIAQ